MRSQRAKPAWRSFLTVSAVAAGLCLAPTVAQAETAIEIPDKYLADCITTKLKKPQGSAFTSEDIANLKSLSCRNGVGSIEGLKAFKNLVDLDLGENRGLKSIDELATLTGLTTLNLQNNEALESVEVIRNLRSLKSLTLNNTGLTNKDLENLIPEIPELRYLAVSNNKITDVSSLAELENLSDLRIASNSVLDLSPLNSLNLTRLYAARQIIDDGPTLYVPAGADTFTASITRTEITTVAGAKGVVVSPDQYSSNYRLETDRLVFDDLDEETEELAVRFEDPSPRNGVNFDGWIYYKVVHADVTSPELNPGTVGLEYSHQFAVTNGFETDAWAMNSDPIPGLEFNLTTGLLSGTPTEAGEYTVEIVASDVLSNEIHYSRKLNVVLPAVQVIEAPVVEAEDPATCSAEFQVTISDNPGIRFEINGVEVSAGAHEFKIGTVALVKAFALEGYTLNGQDTWELSPQDSSSTCDGEDTLPTDGPTTEGTDGPTTEGTDGTVADASEVPLNEYSDAELPRTGTRGILGQTLIAAFFVLLGTSAVVLRRRTTR